FAFWLTGHSNVGNYSFDADQPVALVLRSLSDHLGPGFDRGTIATESGVYLQVHPRRPLPCLCRLSDPVQLPTGDPQVDVLTDGGGEVGVPAVQPGQNRRVDAFGAQLPRLAEVGGSQPVGTSGERGAGCSDDAVAVAVGLNGGHDFGRPHIVSHCADVMGDSLGVDDSHTWGA